MKRIIVLLLTLSMTAGLSSTVCFAEETESTLYHYDNCTVEVSGVDFDSNEAKRIADSMCGGQKSSVPSFLSGGSASCSSHSLKSYTTTVTEHGYYDDVPACRKTVYAVAACANSGCDYMIKELLSETRVGCCMAKIFPDVGYGEWYSRAVLLVKQRGIMLGSDGYFHPNAPVTRAEFVMTLARFANADMSKYTKSPFTDAPVTAWYGKAVAWAKSNKIAGGYSPKYFGPDDPITREQMCVMLVNYIEKFDIDLTTAGEKDFSDKNEISSWAVSAVRKCGEWGVVNGMEGGAFRPKETTTRAQSAQLMYNLIHKAGLAYNKAFEEAGNNNYSGGGMHNMSVGDLFGSGSSVRYPFLDDKLYYSFKALANRLSMSYSYIYNEYTKNEHTYFARYFDTTVMTEEEFIDGIAVSYYRYISERGSVLFPCVDGEEAEFKSGRVKIRLNHYNLLKRPSVSYELADLGVVDIIHLPTQILDSYREASITDLLGALDSNVLDLRSYDDATVNYFYEEEFPLADRSVTAFVSEYCGDSEGYMHIWFMYDGAIVRMYGHTDTIEEKLSTLSFCEKALE